MHDESKKIIGLMSEVRKLFNQIAILLGSCDQIVGTEKWKSVNSSTVTGHNSASLSNPQHWAPEYLCRFYENVNYPNIFAYVSVLIDNRDDNPNYFPKERGGFEPIITSGYFKYSEESDKKYNMGNSRWHIYSEDRKYEGAIFSLTPDMIKGSDKNSNNFIELRSMALPLVTISDSNELETKIIKPILKNMIELKNV